MSNLHIITGYKGQNHIAAADVGSFNAAIFGDGQYVLNRGSKFATTIVSANQIRVSDGDLLMQGRHIRLNEGTNVVLSIDNGSQGMKRNDLVVARYTKESDTGIEDCNLVVIKGTPASSNPVDPSVVSGNIIEDHVLVAEMPLFRIPIDGLNVQTPVQLFSIATISLPDGSVSSSKLASSSVSSAKIANSAVTESKIADGAVGTAKIADGAVSSAKIANNAVNSAKIENGSVSTDKIASSFVLPVEKGGTGATTAADARSNLSVPTLNNGKIQADQAESNIVEVSGNYTVVEGNRGCMLKVNATAATTIFIPSFSNGFEMEILAWGTGAITITCTGSGQTFKWLKSDGTAQNSASVVISGNYGILAIKQISSDSWLVKGDIKE